jgi:uncharacterized membrane protein YczE
VASDRSRLAIRLIQLYVGLALYGMSSAFLVVAGLGLGPWDVLHQGLARHSSLAIGTWSIIVGAFVLLLWIPLRQRPGLGTLSNVVLVGLSVNATLALVPMQHHVASRIAFLVAGVVLNGVATGCYIGAGFGAGPRDGLMTGIAARRGTIRSVRTAIEVTVLVIGFLLGGSVGIGTVAYALGIGPLSHIFIPLLTLRRPDTGPTPDPA